MLKIKDNVNLKELEIDKLKEENKQLKEEIKIKDERINEAIAIYENDDYSTIAYDMYKELKGSDKE